MQKVKVITLASGCLRRAPQVLKFLPGAASTLAALWHLEKSLLTKEAVALRGVTKPPATPLSVSVYSQCRKVNLLFPLCFRKKPLCPLKTPSLWLTYRINRDEHLGGSVCPFLLEWLMVSTQGFCLQTQGMFCSSNIWGQQPGSRTWPVLSRQSCDFIK